MNYSDWVEAEYIFLCSLLNIFFIRLIKGRKFFYILCDIDFLL